MNKKITSFLSASAALLAMPLMALAIVPVPIPKSILIASPWDLIELILMFLVWPLVVMFIVLMFILAGMHFFTAQGEPGKIAQARQFVLWGVVGVVVILLSFSIVFAIEVWLGVN